MISAVVLTHNEEKNIEKCLSSLVWCAEIVVIDDYSTDKTVEIVKRFGVSKACHFLIKVYKRHLNNDFALQRNFGLSKANGDWILFVDADEIITQSLREEIELKLKKETNFNGFYIKRKDFFMGKALLHGEVRNIKFVRLAKKNFGRWKRKVHEYWDIEGSVGDLNNPIVHSKNENLSEFIEQINFYSSIHASENKKEGKRSSLFKIVFYPIGKFIVNYFFKLGFLDGSEGFILAIVMSFHSFLSWTKLWTF